jgi:hypothetical protein
VHFFAADGGQHPVWNETLFFQLQNEQQIGFRVSEPSRDSPASDSSRSCRDMCTKTARTALLCLIDCTAQHSPQHAACRTLCCAVLCCAVLCCAQVFAERLLMKDVEVGAATVSLEQVSGQNSSRGKTTAGALSCVCKLNNKVGTAQRQHLHATCRTDAVLMHRLVCQTVS